MNIIESNLSFRAMSARSKTEVIILHHSGTTTETIQGAHAYHLSLGWSGVGYHFLVRKDGNVYRGRPENMVGAHTYNHNSTSIGICFEGNYENETAMNSAQIQSGTELLAYLKGIYGDIPVKKHKDYNTTACPGRYFPYDDIVNGNVSSVPVDTTDTTDVTDPCLRIDSSGEAVKTLQTKLNTLKSILCMSFDALNVDGIFGAKTETAVKEFQNKVGLSIDGIVGPCTWAALDSAILDATAPIQAPETITNDRVEVIIPEIPHTSPLKGDINNDGQVTASDALTALQACVSKITLTDEQKKQADVNNDGNVTASDSLDILQTSVGK